MALPRWTDSHCHLQEPLQDPSAVDAVLARAGAAGVERVICIGTGRDTSLAALALAERVVRGRQRPDRDRHDDVAVEGAPVVRATIGLHPHDASDGLSPVAELLENRAGGGLVVGVGECGLDYYYEHSPREVQREVFAEQVRLAGEHGLALVVHTRDAWDDTIAILEREGMPRATVIHCFSGGPAEARRCLDLGAHLSFSGLVTFKSAGEVRDAARLCPLERLLVETDAPFLAPVPYRGKPNEPAFVTVVGEAVAALRNEHVADLAAATSANAGRVFGLAPVAG
jgi:TatD DNase family protein